MIPLVLLMLAGASDNSASDVAVSGAEARGPAILSIIGMGLLALFVLGSIVPSIAVSVRRFHDQDKSGWLYLLSFIPYIGGLVVLVFMCLDGTRGPNQYGEDPKNPGHEGVFE